MNRLAGQVVVITGAARGIGRACTEAFLDEGAAVVAADRSWAGADDLAARIEAEPHALAQSFDITDPDQVASAKDEVVARLGTVDVLINNVGLRQKDLYPPSGAVSVLESTNADWEAMFAVNVLGTLNVTRAFIAPMLAQGHGSVINIGSRNNPQYRNQPYAGSKAALTSLSLYLAEEVRARHVAVNVLFPTGTMTTGSMEMVTANRALGILMSPLLSPGHVVPLALHLAEQAAEPASGETWVTGQTLEAVEWNRTHGHGGPEAWLAEPV
jgi:NAD(P)-dependent dehydrogenase (short-subunit alcohol dehydrogenase family)